MSRNSTFGRGRGERRSLILVSNRRSRTSRPGINLHTDRLQLSRRHESRRAAAQQLQQQQRGHRERGGDVLHDQRCRSRRCKASPVLLADALSEGVVGRCFPRGVRMPTSPVHLSCPTSPASAKHERSFLPLLDSRNGRSRAHPSAALMPAHHISRSQLALSPSLHLSCNITPHQHFLPLLPTFTAHAPNADAARLRRPYAGLVPTLEPRKCSPITETLWERGLPQGGGCLFNLLAVCEIELWRTSRSTWPIPEPSPSMQVPDAALLHTLHTARSASNDRGCRAASHRTLPTLA